jgi:pimeloyl-ACP methyl ester carboxylesterase
MRTNIKETIHQPYDWFLRDPNPGGKRVCILLHGLGTDSSSWVNQLGILEKAGYRPVAPDLPGFGRTPYLGNNWTIRLVLDQLAGLIEQKGFDPVTLIGLSLGGAIGLKFAIEYPEMLERMILVNTFACLRPRKLNEWYYLARRFIIANFKTVSDQAEIVAANLFPGKNQEYMRRIVVQGIMNTDSRVYRAAMKEIGLFDVRKQLRRIQIPVLVVSGSDDKTVGLEVQNELAHGIIGSKHTIISHAGHAVTIDQYDQFNKIMIDFLGGNQD